MEEGTTKKSGKQHNHLPIWGNEASMNLNPLILANIQGSSYFKVHLFKLKTYHEVVDEIYYQVKHMEPWERGSRKTSGQTGMCGGVRGVGAGGIVSTAYCLLYKLYTLRLTRKQVNGLLNHTDSPFIRALGFMYLRYTQPPGDLYDWYEDYLQDEEEIDVKAGSGQVITIGQMVYQFLTKLDWFSTLFPRIPVPIQKQIEKKVEQYCRDNNVSLHQLSSQRTVATSGSNVVGYDTEVGGGGGGNGGGGGGGNGGGGAYERTEEGATSSREAHSKRGYPPVPTNYRTDHDDRERDYQTFAASSSSTSRRREDRPTSSSKHKKKHKHRSRSRSRTSHTRSESRSRKRHDRKTHREQPYDRDSERHRTKGRDNYDERRHR